LDIVGICLDKTRLYERAPIEVDLRWFNLDDVESRLEKGEDLLTWSVRFGRPLYDADGVWRRIVNRWYNRIALPDASMARERAATVRLQLDDMLRVGDRDAVIDLRVS